MKQAELASNGGKKVGGGSGGGGGARGAMHGEHAGRCAALPWRLPLRCVTAHLAVHQALPLSPPCDCCLPCESGSGTSAAARGSLCTRKPSSSGFYAPLLHKPPMPAIRVCASPQVVEIDGQRILLAEVDGAVKAVSNK